MPKYVYDLEKCPYCDETRKSTGLHKHVKTHGDKLYHEYQESKKIKSKSIKIDSGKFRCGECDFEGNTVQSVSSHWWRNHTDHGKNHIAIESGTKYSEDRVAWNKGLSVETDDRVKLMGETISKVMKKQVEDGTYVPRSPGPDALKQLSVRQSLNIPVENVNGMLYLDKKFKVLGKETWL